MWETKSHLNLAYFCEFITDGIHLLSHIIIPIMNQEEVPIEHIMESVYMHHSMNINQQLEALQPVECVRSNY